MARIAHFIESDRLDIAVGVLYHCKETSGSETQAEAILIEAGYSKLEIYTAMEKIEERIELIKANEPPKQRGRKAKSEAKEVEVDAETIEAMAAITAEESTPSTSSAKKSKKSKAVEIEEISDDDIPEDLDLGV